MNSIFLNNYNTNLFEKIVFPIIPVYGIRHIKEGIGSKTWEGRVAQLLIGAAELIPFYGALIAILERAFAWYYLSANPKGTKFPLTGKNFTIDSKLDEKINHVAQTTPVEKNPDKKIDYPQNSPSPVQKKFQPLNPVSPTLIPAKITPFSNPVSLSPLSVSSIQEATYHLLATSGFVSDSDDIPYKGMTKGEIQGNKVLRKTVAAVTKRFPEAISLKALKEQREINIEQYMTIKIKRLAHALSMKGTIALPSGNKINMEGFCEAFTVPMTVSSFLEYSKNSSFYSKEDYQWIANNLNQTVTSDHAESDDIQVNALLLQDPNFVGPLSFGTGFDWHSTATIFFGNYLFFNNCGVGSEPGIHIYWIPDRSLLTEGVIWELTKRQEISEAESYGEDRFKEVLGAKKVYYQRRPPQTAGNCTLISMETALLALMAMRNILNVFGDGNENLQSTIDQEMWGNIFETIIPEFEKWRNFDRKAILRDMLEEIQEWQQKKNSFSKHRLDEAYKTLLSKLIPGYDPQRQTVDSLLEKLK